MRLIFFYTLLLLSPVTFAQTDRCREMADLAKTIADIRDLGTPLSSVEEKLSSLPNEREKAMAITVANIVYSTKHKGIALKNEVLKKCR